MGQGSQKHNLWPSPCEVTNKVFNFDLQQNPEMKLKLVIFESDYGTYYICICR